MIIFQALGVETPNIMVQNTMIPRDPLELYELEEYAPCPGKLSKKPPRGLRAEQKSAVFTALLRRNGSSRVPFSADSQSVGVLPPRVVIINEEHSFNAVL